MADLITTALTFSRESTTEYFIKPLFLEEDIKSIVDVHLDVKSSKKLDFVDALSKITKAFAQGTSFTSSTGITITQKTLTTYAMKAEVRQNGRAFYNYCKQAALKSGVNMNDISGTLFEQIVMEIFIKALKADFNRQIFFGDTTKETVSSSIATGTADVNYNVYDGFWTWVEEAITATTIPATQYIDLNSTTYLTTAGVKQVRTCTLSGASGSGTLTINGTGYLVTFSSTLTATAAAFVTAFAATIQARFNGATVTSSGADIIVTAKWAGVPISVSFATIATLAGSMASTTANVAMSTPKAGGALAAFQAMYLAMPPEFKEMKAEAVILATSSMVDNYRISLQSVSAGSEAAYFATINGVRVLAYNGIPVVEKASWDSIISNDFGGAHPNRALLVLPKNLAVGTDASDDMLNAELYYDQNTQENVFRVEYQAGTQYKFTQYIVAAY